MGSSGSSEPTPPADKNEGLKIIQNVATLHSSLTENVTTISIAIGGGLLIIIIALIYICYKLRQQKKAITRSIIPLYSRLNNGEIK